MAAHHGVRGARGASLSWPAMEKSAARHARGRAEEDEVGARLVPEPGCSAAAASREEIEVVPEGIGSRPAALAGGRR